MRWALEFAFEAERLDVVFVELALGNIAVIAFDLLLGLELGAEVGRLALAALAMLAWPVFTLVVGAAGAAPDVLAHPAIDLVFRFRALRHRDSSYMSVRFNEERALLCALEASTGLQPSKAKGRGCVKQQTRSRLAESAPEGRPPKGAGDCCQTLSTPDIPRGLTALRRRAFLVRRKVRGLRSGNPGRGPCENAQCGALICLWRMRILG